MTTSPTRGVDQEWFPGSAIAAPVTSLVPPHNIPTLYHTFKPTISLDRVGQIIPFFFCPIDQFVIKADKSSVWTALWIKGAQYGNHYTGMHGRMPIELSCMNIIIANLRSLWLWSNCCNNCQPVAEFPLKSISVHNWTTEDQNQSWSWMEPDTMLPHPAT
jgi:hypothetical protein